MSAGVEPIVNESSALDVDAELVAVYRTAAAVPVPIWGDLIVTPENVTVRSKWSYIDMDREEDVTLEMTHRADLSQDGQHTLGAFTYIRPATEVNESIISTTLSRGSRGLRAVHKEITQRGKQVDRLEFWEGDTRRWVYDADRMGQHGRILVKGHFESTEWSRSEAKFLFVAEKKVAQPKSFIRRKSASDLEQETKCRSEEEENQSDSDGVAVPVVVVVCLPLRETEHGSNGTEPDAIENEDIELKAKRPNNTELEVQVIKMNNVSLGQAVFTPDEKGVILVGMTNTPACMGYSRNRPQRLYHFDFESKNFTEIGDRNKFIFSPRFTNPGHHLLYLQNEIGGPHNMASELVRMEWPGKCKRVVVTVPDNPQLYEFPGLYRARLLRQCTTDNGNFLYLQTQWHSTVEIVQVDLRTRDMFHVTALSMPDYEMPKNWELLSVNGDFILAACSSCADRPTLVVGRMDRFDNKMRWSFYTQGDRREPLDQGLLGYRTQPQTQVLTYPTRPIRHPSKLFEVVYVTRLERIQKLIVIPHDDPHSASTIGYSASNSFLFSAGYDLLFVNYRGSTGFGDNNMKSLRGHMGDFDVADVHRAVCDQLNQGSGEEVVVLGEGYGGFIAAHLAGQYPSTYKACYLVDPVIDLSSILALTDAAETFWYESGCEGPFRHSSLASDKDLEKLRACSPIAHADKIKAPCFIHLSSGDRRIDHCQGLELYRRLKSRGVETRCNPCSDRGRLTDARRADMFINAVSWFDRFLPS